MFKFVFNLTLILVIIFCVFVYRNSQRTFEAKFKNIDGLPVGAQVTALGVPVGKVIKTRPYKDGIIVTIRITNKRIQNPVPGSQLTITSFRPGRGRVLEIIPPQEDLSDDKSFIVQEPITTDSWLNAALDLLDGLKYFSNAVIKQVTPENFQRTRLAFSRASESLNQIADKLAQYESTLSSVKDKFATRASEANALLMRLQEPVASLNKIVDDKNLPESLKHDLEQFSQNLSDITANITKEDFVQNAIAYKTMILNVLNDINSSLVEADEQIKDPVLKEKIRSFNEHLVNLNARNEMISVEDINNLRKVVKNAKELTVKASQVTKEYSE